jgi:hypothetical protein
MLACCNGTHFQNATLTARKTGAEQIAKVGEANELGRIQRFKKQSPKAPAYEGLDLLRANPKTDSAEKDGIVAES